MKRKHHEHEHNESMMEQKSDQPIKVITVTHGLDFDESEPSHGGPGKETLEDIAVLRNYGHLLAAPGQREELQKNVSKNDTHSVTRSYHESTTTSDSDLQVGTWDAKKTAVVEQELEAAISQMEEEISERRRSVFEESSSDDTDHMSIPNIKTLKNHDVRKPTPNIERLTVNLKEAKHVNVSGDMGNLKQYK